MDWNEDGLKDLLVGEYSGGVRYYRNIGSVGQPTLTFDSYLTVRGDPLNVGSYSQPWVNDWNEDGLKDLLVGASDGRVYLYINVGTNAAPVFSTTEWVTLASGSQVDFHLRSGPVVIDLNNDGVKDLLSGGIDGYLYYCQNNGTNAVPQLADTVALQTGTLVIDIGNTSRLTATDWDGDGTVDLIAGGYDCRTMLFLQAPTTGPTPMIDLTNFITTIPSSGGTVDYEIEVNNNTAYTIDFDIWTEIQLESDYFVPSLSRTGLSLDPHGIITRDLTQNVPGSAPYGYYYIYGHVGDYAEKQVYSRDAFYIHKSYFDGSEDQVDDWNCTGWMAEDISEIEVFPETVILSAAPNPFNPVTTINFNLARSERVKLTVYNLQGRKIATLVDGYRVGGTHQVTWDASSLPAGIYLIDLQAGHTSMSNRVVLLK